MPYIDLKTEEPGIIGLLLYNPRTGRLLAELTEVLLRGPSTLTRGERELIAAYVSSQNECRFCYRSHTAFAVAQLPEGEALVGQVCADVTASSASEKLKALLAIAGAVRESGLSVTEKLVELAREAGASDAEIHDTVLIAAAFCMFNRYVDGLGTVAPDDPKLYEIGAQMIVESGYLPLLAGTGQTVG
jgi:uncharacterized peroxidase-related enzyme